MSTTLLEDQRDHAAEQCEPEHMPPVPPPYFPPQHRIQADSNAQKRLRKRMRILARDNWACVYCGKDFLANAEAMWSASVDHIRTAGRGGGNQATNLVACCRRCNELRGNVVITSIDEGRQLIASRRADQLATFLEEARVFGVELMDRPTADGPDLITSLGFDMMVGSHVDLTRQVEIATRRMMRHAAAIRRAMKPSLASRICDAIQWRSRWTWNRARYRVRCLFLRITIGPKEVTHAD